MLYHDNNIVSYIAKLAYSCATSPIGRNMAYLRYQYDVNFTDSMSKCVSCIHQCFILSSERQSIINNARTLIQCLHGESFIEGFDYTMLDALLTYVCVN